MRGLYPGVCLQVMGISHDGLVGQEEMIEKRQRPSESRRFVEEKVPLQIFIPGPAGELIEFT